MVHFVYWLLFPLYLCFKYEDNIWLFVFEQHVLHIIFFKIFFYLKA